MKTLRSAASAWIAAAALAAGAAGSAAGQEESGGAGVAAPGVEGEGTAQKTAPSGRVQYEVDWMEGYYLDPRPGEVVGQIKDWAEDGALDEELFRPALVAFLSQVLRQNREEMADWYAQLDGLTPDQKQVLHTAMLFSRTSEADEIMRELFGERYEEQRRETSRILEMPLDKRYTLDMLWGFFYATGSRNAIRRVVLCFRFGDAPEQPEGLDVPEGFMPFYKLLPEFAFESLISNAERHPRVLEVLEEMLEGDGSLTELEKEGVHSILSELLPEKYPPSSVGESRA